MGPEPSWHFEKFTQDRPVPWRVLSPSLRNGFLIARHRESEWIPGMIGNLLQPEIAELLLKQ
jgi:hypothetical protein